MKVQLGIAFDIHLEDVKMITLPSRGDLDHLIAFQNKGIDSMIRREKMVMTLPCWLPRKNIFSTSQKNKKKHQNLLNHFKLKPIHMTISFTSVNFSLSPVIYCCSEIGVFVSSLLFSCSFFIIIFETKAEMLLNQQVLFWWVRGYNAPWLNNEALKLGYSLIENPSDFGISLYINFTNLTSNLASLKHCSPSFGCSTLSKFPCLSHNQFFFFLFS